jgi:hypothetical protein
MDGLLHRAQRLCRCRATFLAELVDEEVVRRLAEEFGQEQARFGKRSADLIESLRRILG